VTEPRRAGQYGGVAQLPRLAAPPTESGPEPPEGAPADPIKPPDFAGLYQSEFGFVWRTLQRLGVERPALDDAAQEVFVVVYRKLDGYDARTTVRSWLFGIALRVAGQRRRTARRRPEHALPVDLPAPEQHDPHGATENAQALRLVYALLDQLDDDKRAVFMLAELEQMTAPEIAEVLGIKLNTVYSRLRAARREFEAALAAYRARAPGSER
jgi:RNA polymerase sigma-70 factor, ECF subfamily